MAAKLTPDGIQFGDGTTLISKRGIIPQSARMVFYQAAAPTGWTKDTTHNDKALRVVSGTASNGGIDSFSTTFGAGKTTASHTLSTPQIAAHTHSIRYRSSGPNTGPFPTLERVGANNPSGLTTALEATTSAGGGGAHSHDLNLDIAYVDTIIATKD